jgi:sugar phosphate isomerase/epimerase
MIRIGNQTAFSARSVMAPFEFAVEQAFTAFEFFPDRGPEGAGGWAETDLDDATRRWIRRTAVENDIELTVHAPLSFNPTRNPEDGRLYNTVALARDIGATLINLHLDVSHGPAAFVTALRPTLKLTAEAKLKLAIENTVWTSPEHFNLFFGALRKQGEVPFSHAGMCFDLGHANLFGATRDNYWAYLDALSPEVPIIHLHLHENYGDRDSHLPLFTGPSRNNATGIVGMLNRVCRRGFAGCAILEQWPEPPSLLTNARDGLLNLLHAGRAVEPGRAGMDVRTF